MRPTDIPATLLTASADLFSPGSLGRLDLRNRAVVAPMTRVSATKYGQGKPVGDSLERPVLPIVQGHNWRNDSR
jgi:hypothetical protein